MKCRICKRVLTNPVSVELGIGPVCRADKDYEKQGEFDFMKAEAIEGFGDVVCSRAADGSVITNVPVRIQRHSFGEFNFGYGGSGPAEFALNILACYIGEEKAREGGLYQKFKFEFIAGIPRDGGTIKREDVFKWLESQRSAA